jgi:predicted Zn finger-like uncharacterized protein
MIFSCDKCSANYKIADSKIGDRGVKVRCKRCSNVIVLRPADLEKAQAEEAEAKNEPSDEMKEEPESKDGAPEDEQESPFDNPGATAMMAAPPAEVSNPKGIFSSLSSESGWSSTKLSESKVGGTEQDGGSSDDDVAENPAGGGLDKSLDLSLSGFDGQPETGELDAGHSDFNEDHDVTGSDESSIVSEENNSEAEQGDENLADEDDDGGVGPLGQEDLDDEDDEYEEDKTEIGSVPGWSPELENTLGPKNFDADNEDPGAAENDDESALALGGVSEDAAGEGAGESTDALEDELAGAFSDMFGGASTGGFSLDSESAGSSKGMPQDPADDGSGATQVVGTEQLDALRAQATGKPEGAGLIFSDSGLMADDSVGPAKSLADESEEDSEGWHVAIDDEDVGPLFLSDLANEVANGRVDAESLVWRSGMSDWEMAGEVSELSSLWSDRSSKDKPVSTIIQDQTMVGGSGLSGLDFGSNLENFSPSPFGGSELDGDPFASVTDGASDPSWQPHGLTEVYQAANIAEAAGGSAGAVQDNPAMGSESEDEDDGWRPGAAGALASLVADEINRMDDSSGMVSQEGALMPVSDESASLDDSGAMSPAFSASDSDLSLGEDEGSLSDLDSMPPAHVPDYGAMNFEAESSSARNYVLLGVAIVSIGLLVVVSVAVTKLAFFSSDPTPASAVAAAEPAPAAVSVTTAKAPPTQAKEEAKETAENVATSADPNNPAPTAVADAPAGTDSPESEKGAAQAPWPQVAVAKTQPSPEAKVRSDKGAKPTDRTKSRPAKKRVTTTAKKAKPKPTPVAKKSPPKKPAKAKSRRSAGCDPVLDFDCDTGSKSSKKKKAKAKLTKNDVLSVVRKKISRINSCGKKYKVKGTVKMEWSIRRNGRTSGVKVLSSKYKGKPVGSCMTKEIKRWRFPAFTGTPPPPVKFPFKLK